jgi:hypothetical protein
VAVKRLRILFDGVEVNETPDGWQDIVSSIKRMKEINSLFITNEAKLTFQEDGYNTLMTKYNEGFCSSVYTELQEYVDNVYQPFFIGIIYLKSAEIDREQCTITVDVEDNSFYAKIDNNKSIEVFPFAEGTKSSASDPLNTQYTLAACNYEKIQLFDPNDGSTIGCLVNPPYSGAAYRINDLFEYMISFMSDNTVSYYSPLFGTSGDYEGLTVTIGIMLRQYDMGGTTEDSFKSNFSKISFQQLFSEVNKKINIGMYVDYSNPLPTIVIDRVRNIRTGNTIFRALNILGLKETIDESELYSSVRLGSTTVNDNIYVAPETGLLFPENISFVGFKEEQFFVLSQCNIDRELDLVSQWVISANVIETAFIHKENTYDNNIFFIMCDKVGANYVARQSNLEGQSGLFPVYYNLDLNGESVMDNYFGAIPLSIAQYLGNVDQRFFAQGVNTFTLAAGVYGLVTFNVVVSDPSGSYTPGNTQSFYTFSSAGLYSFSVKIVQSCQPNDPPTPVGYYMEHYDALSVLIERKHLGDIYNPFGYITETFSTSVLVNAANEYVRIVYFTNEGSNYAIRPTCEFKCINTSNGGGLYKTFEPEDYPVILHKWEYPLHFNNFKAIAQNQTGQIEFSRYNEFHYSGWIDSVKFKRFSDEKAQFVTYRSKNLPVTRNIDLNLRQVQVSGQIPGLTFSLNPDYYGRPFGGGSEITRTFFFNAFSTVNISMPATFGGHDAGDLSNQTIVITKYTTTTTTYIIVSVPVLATSFIVEPDANYIISLGYDLATAGDNLPSVEPFTTSPSVAGGNGTAFIALVNPSNPADYSFLWSTGATTPSITAPTGSYWCEVTYIPGTFDNNVLTFDIQIPVSETGS